MLTNYFTSCHNVSWSTWKSLCLEPEQWTKPSLCIWYCQKYLKVPMDSLVLETAATQQGLRPDKGIKPVLVRCIPIPVFCQKHSHHCSTSSKSKSYTHSISFLAAILLWAIPCLKQALVEMHLITLQHFAVWKVMEKFFPYTHGAHRIHRTIEKEWKGICFKHQQYLMIFRTLHLI